MSALFDRLQRVFDDGHGVELPDLLSDAHFAVDEPRPAAVLVAVTDRPQPGLILTQRLHDMRDHPGQVALPGGKQDPGEDSIEAALREADEELALRAHDVRVVGATDRYVTGTGFEITPVLGLIPPDLPLVANPAEVESWFEVPLATVLDPASYDARSVFWRGAERRYYELHHEGYRIWGVTAAILLNLSSRLELTELFDG